MKIAVIVLAAGQSRRFGASNKLLAMFDGEALIVRTLRRVGQAHLPGHEVGLVAVTGGEMPNEVADTIIAAGLSPSPIVVANPKAHDGMGTSIAAGIASLDHDVAAAVVMPGDMPLVSVDLLETLIRAFIADGGLRPTHPVLADGTQMSPVVWPGSMFGPLAALNADQGGKQLLTKASVCTIPIGNPGELADVDTPSDLLLLQQQSDGG